MPLPLTKSVTQNEPIRVSIDTKWNETKHNQAFLWLIIRIGKCAWYWEYGY